MILKINGVEVGLVPAPAVIKEENFTRHPATLKANVDRMLATLDKPMWRAAVTTLAWLTMPHMAFAASVSGGWALIRLLQQGAFWVGLAVSLWGVYEWMVGGPGWKERIIKGVLGYLLCLVLPLIFVTLRSAGIGQ